jgi:hypothetical protein
MVQIIPNPSALIPPSAGGPSITSLVTSIVSIATGDPASWVYAVKGIQLPGRSLGELTHKRMGITRKIAGDPTYDDLAVTFLAASTDVIGGVLKTWHDNIAGGATNARHDMSDTEGGTVIVEALNGKGVPAAIWKFEDAWPKVIDPVELNMDSNDTALEYSVQFAYTHWQRIF